MADRRTPAADRPPGRNVVLLGIGHTNAHVLREWRMAPPPGGRLTCISNDPVAIYSGMMPGVLAGQYRPDEATIDLAGLSAAAGARLVVGDVERLDLPGRRLLLVGLPPVPFDVLSIGIGSVPSFEAVVVTDASRLVTSKPMQTLPARLKTGQGRLRRTIHPLAFSGPVQSGGVPINHRVSGG